VTEAELKVVLNTSREHNFQDVVKKNGRRNVNGAYPRKGTNLEVMLASRPKVTF
jgi:hypothetical protein